MLSRVDNNSLSEPDLQWLTKKMNQDLNTVIYIIKYR